MDWISLLPADWQGVISVITQIVVAASALVALAKTALGKPQPADPKWKKALFAVIQALDFVALNSETVVAKRKRAKAEAVVGALTAQPSEDIDDEGLPQVVVNHYRGEPRK